mmetsp:Transcript_105110/g.272214  ORF Transcript_105110/g.272214 Transcript_105110/m.272214 type:complete len:201 (+) Transcript_105110:521-1123(+)
MGLQAARRSLLLQRSSLSRTPLPRVPTAGGPPLLPRSAAAGAVSLPPAVLPLVGRWKRRCQLQVGNRGASRGVRREVSTMSSTKPTPRPPRRANSGIASTTPCTPRASAPASPRGRAPCRSTTACTWPPRGPGSAMPADSAPPRVLQRGAAAPPPAHGWLPGRRMQQHAAAGKRRRQAHRRCHRPRRAIATRQASPEQAP